MFNSLFIINESGDESRDRLDSRESFTHSPHVRGLISLPLFGDSNMAHCIYSNKVIDLFIFLQKAVSLLQIVSTFCNNKWTCKMLAHLCSLNSKITAHTAAIYYNVVFLPQSCSQLNSNISRHNSSSKWKRICFSWIFPPTTSYRDCGSAEQTHLISSYVGVNNFTRVCHISIFLEIRLFKPMLREVCKTKGSIFNLEYVLA